jgi:signal transduction histidine kinase
VYGERLRLVIGSGVGDIVADPVRLEQVLTNVVGNALKYSPDGGEVMITLTGDEGGIVITVHDEGIGLPAGASEAIFQPFGRAHNAADRNVPGMGLGLYICRSIVQSHGGRIWAESAGEGQGTTLRIWLPADGPAAVTGELNG